jgi:hypothetical protein
MNIFYLHPVPAIAAGMHCDKHVGKMLIETCQLLATTHHLHGNGDKVSYKATHANHPSAIWARQSAQHYRWLVDLGLGLGREFYKRYGKHHKSQQVLINELLDPPPALQNTKYSWVPPTLAMPDEYKANDPVTAYRRYYASKRDRMAMVYHKGAMPVPYWLQALWNGNEYTNLEAA